MNYYKPLQRESDKRWDYTCSNRRTGIHPIGYCRKWKAFEPSPYLTEEMCQRENQKLAPFISKFHSDGHATYEEACACYKEYLLDHRMERGLHPDEQRKCKVCGAWTQVTIQVNYSGRYDLCEQHATLEEVAKLFNVEESFGSY